MSPILLQGTEVMKQIPFVKSAYGVPIGKNLYSPCKFSILNVGEGILMSQ